CTVERGKGPDVSGSVGDTVVLPCSCKGPDLVNPQTVQWGYRKVFKLGDYKEDHSVVSKDGSVNQRYRGRVERPTQNSPGQVSLIISPLTEEDEGTYLCGNRDYNRTVTLYVGGCSMVGQRHTLTRSPGESVLLPCPCPSTGHVKPERVTWSYSKPRSSDRTPVSNDAGSYRGRVRTFDQTGSRNLSLLISDLTKEDAGDYTCTSDQHTAKVVLQVKVLLYTGVTEGSQRGHGGDMEGTQRGHRGDKEGTESGNGGCSVKRNGKQNGSCSTDQVKCNTLPVDWRGHRGDTEGTQRGHGGDTEGTQRGHRGDTEDLTVEDRGTYSCWINQNQYRTFTLTVKGKLLDSLTFTHMPYETVMKLEWIIRV
ncbi:hypothetical protein NFI96_008867, partial [Prochilodus magdalenae]